MRFHDITTCDVNNGEGFRVTLWVAGCTHHCQGCRNPETWDFKGGQPFGKEAHDYLFSELSKPYIQGVTALAKEIKEKLPGKDIWLYTGFTIEQIEANDKLKQILPYVDVIVDGEYVKALRDVTLAFSGSRNQRIISIKNGKTVKR